MTIDGEGSADVVAKAVAMEHIERGMAVAIVRDSRGAGRAYRLRSDGYIYGRSGILGDNMMQQLAIAIQTLTGIATVVAEIRSSLAPQGATLNIDLHPLGLKFEIIGRITERGRRYADWSIAYEALGDALDPVGLVEASLKELERQWRSVDK